MIGRGPRARVNPAFDRFLRAPFDEDNPKLFLTVVSVLARLDLDPWHEAAVLASLPPAAAVERLKALLEKLPSSGAVDRDTARIAARLIELLPRTPRDDAASFGSPARISDATQTEASSKVEEIRVATGRGWSKSVIIALLLILAAVATFTGARLDLWLSPSTTEPAELTAKPAQGVD
jgi:hypothetical protein